MKCPRCGSDKVAWRGETLPPLGEVDYWAPVREEGFLCRSCDLLEQCLTDAGAAYEAFRARWGHPMPEPTPPEEQAAYRKKEDEDDIARARAWTWPRENPLRAPLDRAGREAWLARQRAEETFLYNDHLGPEPRFAQNVPHIPRNEDIEARILGRPDDVAPRWELVRWLRTQDHPTASATADFIEGQLEIAAALVDDPKSDIRDQLPLYAFKISDSRWWHRWPSDRAKCFVSPLEVLDGWGHIASGAYYRGFVEDVAIKAEKFLELADELYSLAPIRQLEITYCKGIHHDDPGVLRALLASPHLDRIRALRLPVRLFGRDKGDYTKLNQLTDRDIELLADSDHVRGLRVLDLEDERLSMRAFDALAASTKLPELSAVYWDVYSYINRPSFKPVLDQDRTGPARPLRGWTAELEARHGPIPWLHVAENYGSEEPDIEAVIEHPVALTKRVRFNEEDS